MQNCKSSKIGFQDFTLHIFIWNRLFLGKNYRWRHHFYKLKFYLYMDALCAKAKNSV